ncbi:hypothetical protein [Halorubrum lipolyticum]|uniref:Oxidoreductase n=1 Tax=Halorubrum lipolyticum DSM 21995 TaxID=1227482 RepID=M0NYR5_9EURY|nr:hypothetical protein [Halorubrum lipolyticum]EMA63042.1 oxidoreductase [Halorubrum lipolyticum DSM 21995]
MSDALSLTDIYVDDPVLDRVSDVFRSGRYISDLVVELYDNTLVTDAEVQTREESSRTYEPPGAEPLRLEVESFLDARRTGETPRASGRVGLNAVRVLEAAERSAATGQAVDGDIDLPPSSGGG